MLITARFYDAVVVWRAIRVKFTSLRATTATIENLMTLNNVNTTLFHYASNTQQKQVSRWGVGKHITIKYIQLFRQRLSHKSVKAYATMPIGIMGTKGLALID